VEYLKMTRYYHPEKTKVRDKETNPFEQSAWPIEDKQQQQWAGVEEKPVEKLEEPLVTPKKKKKLERIEQEKLENRDEREVDEQAVHEREMHQNELQQQLLAKQLEQQKQEEQYASTTVFQTVVAVLGRQKEGLMHTIEQLANQLVANLIEQMKYSYLTRPLVVLLGVVCVPVFVLMFVAWLVVACLIAVAAVLFAIAWLVEWLLRSVLSAVRKVWQWVSKVAGRAAKGICVILILVLLVVLAALIYVIVCEAQGKNPVPQ